MRVLRTIAYVSRATRDLTEIDLRQLFIAASQFNDTVDVTGLLLFSDGVFMQTIEGHHENVQMVYERIRRAPLHSIENVFVDDEIERRVYPGWAMMASLFPSDPTLISFLEARREAPLPAFTQGQVLAIKRTLNFAKFGKESV